MILGCSFSALKIHSDNMLELMIHSDKEVKVKLKLNLHIKNSRVDKNDQLYMQLLYLMHHTAMQELGKIPNPISGEISCVI